jgi:hypothetical protein
MSKIVYIVQKIDWQYNDEVFHVTELQPIKAFANREVAEKYRIEKEYEARDELEGHGFPRSFDGHTLTDEESTFFGGISFDNLTTLPFARFVATIISLGIEPPMEEHDNTFWSRVENLPYEQRHAVYDLLDRLKFFDIVEMEVE